MLSDIELVEEVLGLQNLVLYLQAQLREAKMSKDTEAANKRIERILRPDMDAGEVDEIVNRIYRQEAEMSEHTDYMGLFTTMHRAEQEREYVQALIAQGCNVAHDLLLVVLMEDEIIHTDEHPFCGDWKCPCHFDEDYVWEHHTQPYRSGLLTWEEAGRLLYGRQV